MTKGQREQNASTYRVLGKRFRKRIGDGYAGDS